MINAPRGPLWLVLSALTACGGSAAKSAPPAAQVPAPTQASVASQPAAADVIASNVLALPRPMTSFGAAAHEGVLYAYGGYFGTPHDYSREGQSGELLRIDVDALQVTSLENGEGVQGAQLVSTAQGLVRVGGMRAENAAGAAEQLVSLTD